MRLVVVAVTALASGCNDQCFVEGLNCETTVPRALSIAAGRAHSCAATTLGVVCWGDGEPPLGAPSYVRAAGDVTCGFYSGAEAIRCTGPTPVGALFGPGDGRYLAMAISKTHGCATTHVAEGYGSVVCWGDAPPPPPTPFGSVVVGSGHTCGTGFGSITCWGRNEQGQSTPPGPPIGLHGFVAADGYTCGLSPEGLAVCWGQAPSQIATTWHFLELAAADAFLCALRDDGTIRCWGDPLDGRTSPPAGMFVTLAVGERHGCAIDRAGEITCWGANEAGQASPP